MCGRGIRLTGPSRRSRALGKLELRLPLDDILRQQQLNGLTVLPISLAHVLAVEHLPPVHKDPFDRVLIAQAQAESATLVSADHLFSDYGVPLLW